MLYASEAHVHVHMSKPLLDIYIHVYVRRSSWRTCDHVNDPLDRTPYTYILRTYLPDTLRMANPHLAPRYGTEGTSARPEPDRRLGVVSSSPGVEGGRRRVAGGGERRPGSQRIAGGWGSSCDGVHAHLLPERDNRIRSGSVAISPFLFLLGAILFDPPPRGTCRGEGGGGCEVDHSFQVGFAYQPRLQVKPVCLVWYCECRIFVHVSLSLSLSLSEGTDSPGVRQRGCFRLMHVQPPSFVFVFYFLSPPPLACISPEHLVGGKWCSVVDRLP